MGLIRSMHSGLDGGACVGVKEFNWSNRFGKYCSSGYNKCGEIRRRRRR